MGHETYRSRGFGLALPITLSLLGIGCVQMQPEPNLQPATYLLRDSCTSNAPEIHSGTSKAVATDTRPNNQPNHEVRQVSLNQTVETSRRRSPVL